MKVNFYREIENGFELIKAYPTIADDTSRFVTNFKSVELIKPEDYNTNHSAKARYDRQVTVYLCCLHRAGFALPANFPPVRFIASQEVRNAVQQGVDPNSGITIENAANWWGIFWDVYDQDSTNVFSKYKQEKGHEWADEDLKALLVMLTRKSNSGKNANCAGFRILNPIREQHTSTVQDPFDQDILNKLRRGNIIIVDLSLGNPQIQAMFSERICQRIFTDAISRFTNK